MSLHFLASADFYKGIGVAFAAISAAEIGFNYGLGDKEKDLFLKYVLGPIKRLFGKKSAAPSDSEKKS